MAESNQQKVTLKKLSNFNNGKLAETVYHECNFCHKTVGLHALNREICDKLSGNFFFCPFCLRHGLNTKNNKDFLVLSFRAIIGYFYYSLYLHKLRIGGSVMRFAEIQDYIDSHVEVGLQNPLFSYDPETMLWFVDFSKVGRGNKKVPIKDIQKTVLNIIACFNLKIHFPHTDIHPMVEKYQEAIDKFYSHRYRPEGVRFLIPTLQGIGGDTKNFKMETSRSFCLKKMVLK